MDSTRIAILLLGYAATACAPTEPTEATDESGTTSSTSSGETSDAGAETTGGVAETESADASTGDESSTGEPPVDPGLTVDCEGEGSPAIIFEEGLGGGTHTNSTAYIRVLLDVETTVCRYNRRGIPPGPSLGEDTRTNADWRDDLIAWMDYEGITEPAIFVAHSAGGVTVRMLRDSHPERIAGAVMIDTSQSQQLAHDLENFPPEMLDEYLAYVEGDNFEQWDLVTSFAEVDALDEDFGDLPMTVLVAGEWRQLDFLSQEENDARYEVWTSAQTELAALSTESVYMVVEDADHQIPTRQPELVAAEIVRVYEAAGG